MTTTLTLADPGVPEGGGGAHPVGEGHQGLTHQLWGKLVCKIERIWPLGSAPP